VVALCWQVITGLKQRIFRLEQQCKEKDNTIKYDPRGLLGGLLGAGLASHLPSPSAIATLAVCSSFSHVSVPT
jgi:hypothetical protein